MPPNAEDQRKLHAEVNQIVNQRFLLSTLAVTLFGGIAAWGLPRSPVPSDTDLGLPYIAAIILMFVLSMLYAASYDMRHYLRLLTTYLEIAGDSNWERHWANYRDEYRYLGYTRVQSAFFAILGILTLTYPILVEYQFRARVDLRWEFFVLVGLLAAYLIMVLGLGLRSTKDLERRVRKRWQDILTKDECHTEVAKSNNDG